MASGANVLGVPAKLLKEFERKTITVDTSTGELFKGTLLEAEENMNMTLNDVEVTYVSGFRAEMSSVYIKGAKIRCIQLPKEAKESVSYLARQESRGGRGGRGGFRGGRGGRGGGGGRSSSSSYDRRRY